MPAESYDFSIEQGTSFGMTIRCADSGNAPIDLSNFSVAKMQWNANNNNIYHK